MNAAQNLRLATLVVLAACAGRGSVYSGRTGPQAVAALYERIDMHGGTPAAVRASLGEPIRTTREPVANRHGYGTDTVITVIHARWQHTFLRLGATGDALLTAVESTDPSVTFPGGVQIGVTTREQLSTRLGAWQDEARDGDSLTVTYQHPTLEAESFVELALVRDTVRLVRWVPYVD